MPVGLVLLVVPLEPERLRVPLEGEHVGRDAVEEPAVVRDDDGAAGEGEERLLERAERVDVEVVRRLVEEEEVAGLLHGAGEVEAVHLAPREVADPLLLVGPLEVEHRAPGAAAHLAAADHDLLLAARDLLPDRLRLVGPVAVLVDVRGEDRLAHLQDAAVGRLEAHDHLEEGRLSGPVRADDADDAALGQVEGEVVEEEVLAVRLLQALRTDDDVAEARAGRDVDLVRLAAAVGAAVGEELLVGLEARLPLGVAGAGGHADPLQLALERLLLGRLGLLLLREARRLLLEPGGVVPLPRNAGAAVELEDPLGDVVEEVAVVRDGDDGAGVLGEVLLEPADRLGVEVVRRLVEEEEVGLLEEDAAERDAPPLAAGDLRDVGFGGRAAEGVHRRLEGPVEVPAVRRLDGVLDAAVLGHDLLHLVFGEALAHLLAQLVEAREELLHRRDGRLDVLEDVLGRVEPRVLGQEADSRSVGGKGLAVELGVDARHDPEERRLPRAVQAEDADLGAWKEGEVDPLQDFPLGRDDLAEVDHRVDVLRCHGETSSRLRPRGRESSRAPAGASGGSVGNMIGSF